MVPDVHGDGLADAGAGGVGNVGTTIPGGGAATASGSSISSRGRSGNASWNGEAASGEAAFGGVVSARSDGLFPVATAAAGIDFVAGEGLAADAEGPLGGTAVGFAVPANVAPARLAMAFPLVAAWPPGVTAKAGAPDLVTPALRAAVAAAAARIFAAAAARAVLLASEPDAEPVGFNAPDGAEGVAAPADAFAARGEVVEALCEAVAAPSDDLAAAAVEAIAAPNDTLAAPAVATAAALVAPVAPAPNAPSEEAPADPASPTVTAAATAAAPVVLAGPAVPAVPPRPGIPTPFVPSRRDGSPASDTPSNTSGSSSSPEPDADESVGTIAESGRASDEGGGV